MRNVIRRKKVTEKTEMIETLNEDDSNKCVRKYTNTKLVLVVDTRATKTEIKKEAAECYKVNPISVNTILTKPKNKKSRGKARKGKTSHTKTAIVTFKGAVKLEIQ